MKKVSIFLIAMSLFAMMFTGCSSILGEDVNATLEDFQGTWYYKTADNKDITLAVTRDEVLIDGLENQTLAFKGTIKNGIFKVFNFETESKIELTVSNARTILHVRGDLIYKNLQEVEILMKKEIDLSGILSDFTADTQATIDDYIGTFEDTAENSNIKFTFTKVPVPTTDVAINSVNITGVNGGTLTGMVVVTKGIATFTCTDETKRYILTMYINKAHDTIRVTGTGLKALTGGKSTLTLKNNL